MRAPRAAVAIAALLACFACSGQQTSPPEPLDPASLAGTWPLELLDSGTVDLPTLEALGERWLGLEEARGWRAPGQAPPGIDPGLARRWQREDRQALELLERLHHQLVCRLGTEPGSFGREVPEGWAAAEASCRELGDAAAAERTTVLRDEAGAPAVPLPAPPAADSVAGLLAPAVDRRLSIGGEELRYRFVLPAQWRRAASRLPGEGEETGLVWRVGTSRWDPGGVIPDAGAMLAGDDPDGRRLARLEREAERLVARWRSSLAREPELEPYPADRALFATWVRRSLYRDLGLAELEAGRPEVALALLEEAVGSVARPEPGPGRDPLLLSAFASARCRAGEIRTCAELLTRMATQPGWQWVGAVAEGAARVAVLPSVTASEVRR